MTPSPNSAIDIYRVKRRAGVRKMLGGLDYTRSVEYPNALRELQLEQANRVLEIGASKLFLGCYIAVRYDVEVHVTDIDPVVNLQARWISRLGRGDLVEAGRFVIRIEDATKLTYPDSSFDRIISISTLEHVRAIEMAAEEVGRVLQPGGLAVITVPVSRERREIFRPKPAYGGFGASYHRGGQAFYEYHLDHAMVKRAIVGPSGLTLRTIRFLGEPGFKMTRVVYHPIFGRFLAFARCVWPYTAHWWYREIAAEEVTSGSGNIAVIVLEKPQSDRRHS